MARLDDQTKPREPEDHYLADKTLSEIATPQGILSRPVRLVNLHSNGLDVIIKGYSHYYGGYATHTREVLFGIGDNYEDMNVGHIPFPAHVDVDFWTESRIEFYTKQAKVLINPDTSIHLNIACPSHSQYYPREKCKHSIMWTMVETPPLSRRRDPGSYIGRWLDMVDEVWVPTELDVNRIGSITSTPIKKMNLGVRTDIFKPGVSPLDIVNTKGKFVFMVDATWSPRKGIEYIIDAYNKAFSSKDPVSLVLMCKYGTRPYGLAYEVCSRIWKGVKKHKILHKIPGMDSVKYYGDSYWSIPTAFKQTCEDLKINNNSPEIYLLDVPVHENIMPHFYASAHCIVGASLGESTWLPGIQALAMGIPIIQMRQNCGGVGEYIPNDYPGLYDCDDYVMANEDLWRGTSIYYKGCEFPRPDVESLSANMRQVFSAYDAARTVTLPIAEDIHANWGWKEKNAAVVERLKEIHADSSSN